MPYELEELELDELSLVDDPASPGARVVLAKRNGGNPSTKGGISKMGDKEKARLKELMDKEGMSEDEAKRYMEKEAQKMADDAQKRADELEKRVEALTKALGDAGFEVDGDKVTKRAEEETIEIDGEKVAKSAVPAPILKRLEAQAKDLDDLKKAAEIERLDKRASVEIPNIGGSPKVHRALLKAVDGISDEETRKGALDALKGASKMLAKSFAEVGHTGADDADENSAMGQLNKMAADYAEANDVTFEQAFAKVCATKKGRELFAKRNAN